MEGFLKSEKAPDPEVWKTHWRSIEPVRERKFMDIHKHIKLAIRNHEALLKDNPRQKWDYVVLQSWRDVSADVNQAYAKYATQLAELAKANGADVILYMTSPETQNQEPVGEPVSPNSADRDLAVGVALQKRLQPRAVVHVPLAIKIIQTGGTDLCFRYKNDGHPNQTCAYLAANLFYAAFTGKNPGDLKFDTIIETKAKDGKDPDGGELKRIFSGEKKRLLQNTAFQATREFYRLAK